MGRDGWVVVLFMTQPNWFSLENIISACGKKESTLILSISYLKRKTNTQCKRIIHYVFCYFCSQIVALVQTSISLESSILKEIHTFCWNYWNLNLSCVKRLRIFIPTFTSWIEKASYITAQHQVFFFDLNG